MESPYYQRGLSEILQESEKKPPPRAEALAEGAILSNTNSPALCRAFFMQDLPDGAGDRYYFDTRVTRVCLLLLEESFSR